MASLLFSQSYSWSHTGAAFCLSLLSLPEVVVITVDSLSYVIDCNKSLANKSSVFSSGLDLTNFKSFRIENASTHCAEIWYTCRGCSRASTYQVASINSLAFTSYSRLIINKCHFALCSQNRRIRTDHFNRAYLSFYWA